MFGQLKQPLVMGLQKFFQFLRKTTNVLDKDSSLILKIVAGFLLAWIILEMAPLPIMNSGIFTNFEKELIQGCVHMEKKDLLH